MCAGVSYCYYRLGLNAFTLWKESTSLPSGRLSEKFVNLISRSYSSCAFIYLQFHVSPCIHSSISAWASVNVPYTSHSFFPSTVPPLPPPSFSYPSISPVSPHTLPVSSCGLNRDVWIGPSVNLAILTLDIVMSGISPFCFSPSSTLLSLELSRCFSNQI